MDYEKAVQEQQEKMKKLMESGGQVLTEVATGAHFSNVRKLDNDKKGE